MSAKPISLEAFEENMRQNPKYDRGIEQLESLFNAKVDQQSMDITMKVVSSIEKVFCGSLLPSIHASMDALTDPAMLPEDKTLVKTEVSQLCRSMELALQGVLYGSDIEFTVALTPDKIYKQFKELQKNHTHLKVAQIIVNTALHEMEQQQISPFDKNIQLYSGVFHVDVSKAESERILNGWVSVILCPKELSSAVKNFIDKPYTPGHGGSSPEFFDLAESLKK